MAAEATQSSQIEGEFLDLAEVRSSVARRLGFEQGGVAPQDRRVEGVVEMSVDAAERWADPLTKERLFRWHAGLFPDGRSPQGPIRVGNWRDDADGPMQIVGPGLKKTKVYFEAPAAERIPAEMEAFLSWYESPKTKFDLVTAGIAHLWFETLHPFEDGNGRIGRAIMDLALARSDQRPWRCYSVSAQVRQERAAYYAALEEAQKGDLNVTAWLLWYTGCLTRALESAASNIDSAIARNRFWGEHATTDLNARQRKVLNLLVAAQLTGQLTNRRWKRITDASDATASRDLDDLVQKGILCRIGAGRSVEYRLRT